MRDSSQHCYQGLDVRTMLHLSHTETRLQRYSTLTATCMDALTHYNGSTTDYQRDQYLNVHLTSDLIPAKCRYTQLRARRTPGPNFTVGRNVFPVSRTFFQGWFSVEGERVLLFLVWAKKSGNESSFHFKPA